MKEFVIDLSGMFGQEGFLPADSANYLNLKDLDGTCCYCDADTEPVLSRRLPPPGGLNWIDSGDYHYLTLLMLRKTERPVRLLLIDNHSDAFPYEGILSCGNWVSKAREEGLLTEDPAAPLYISLDLDALSPAEFSTNWDQGNMTLQELYRILEKALKDPSGIAGMDICGGLTISKGASDCQLEKNREFRERLRILINALK